jgi:hypothetical protein
MKEFSLRVLEVDRAVRWRRFRLERAARVVSVCTARRGEARRDETRRDETRRGDGLNGVGLGDRLVFFCGG